MKKAEKLSLVFILVLLLMVPFLSMTVSAEEDWSGYTPISTAEELSNIRNDLDGKYYLTKDIELTGKWVPIGNAANSLNAFSGVLDGNGHTISGMQAELAYYTSGTPASAGLFGYLSGAVKNLHLEDGSVYAEAYVSSSSSSAQYAYAGAVAGYVMEGGRIENCTNSCEITAVTRSGHNSRAGGMAGFSYGYITNCHNYGEIHSACENGGIVGRNGGIVTLSSNHGKIPYGCGSSDFIGGITGYCRGTVTQCYNTGSLGNDDSMTGGIAGALEYATINDCFNTGALYGDAGGIYCGAYGTNYNTNKVNRCYSVGSSAYGIAGTTGGVYTCVQIYDSYHLDNVTTSVGGDSYKDYSLTAEEMMQQASFDGFDFETTWTMPEGEGYPFPLLKKLAMDTSVESIAWKTEPTKTLYNAGEALDVSDGFLKITCKSGVSFEIPAAADMVSGFNTNEIGLQALTVTYGGQSVGFDVSVRGYAGGTGTAEDPYLIATEEQLSCVKYEMDACYKLTADITITNESFHGIGSGRVSWTEFTGVFDGAGHTVSGLRINFEGLPFYVNAGFIAYNEGTIKNLGLVDVEVIGKSSDKNGTRNFGGIAGFSSGRIENCFVEGTVSGSNYSFNVGGIAGRATGVVTNCYSIVNTPSDTTASGGITGSGGTISNCYSMGETSDGINVIGADVTNCYYLKAAIDGDGKRCTREEMEKQSTFTGFDFTNTWKMSDNAYYPYPVLREVPFEVVPSAIAVTEAPSVVLYNLETKKFTVNPEDAGELVLTAKNGATLEYPLSAEMLSGNKLSGGGSQKLKVSYGGKSVTMTTMVYTIESGSGTEKSPFILKDKTQLPAMRFDTDAYYRLGADIVFAESDEPWLPIKSFSGVLDGAGYRIEGLKIEDKDYLGSYADDSCVGLFARCSGTIKNLGMVDCTVKANFYSGTNYIGGFAGSLNGGTVSQCYFAGTVTATGYGNGRVGGIAGMVNDTARILDCYNLGTLSGSTTYCWLGGIVAHNYGEVSRCYNAGKLSSKNPRGTVGYDEYSVINNNYYLADSALVSGNGTELTEAQMKKPDSFDGFDFDNVWVMRNKNGYRYPELRAVALKLNAASLEMVTPPNGVVYNEKTGAVTACGGKLKMTCVNGLMLDVDMKDTKVSGVTSASGVKNVTFTIGGKSVKAQVPVYSVASGSGTASDPYVISKKAHLKSLTVALDANFKLAADITFTSSDFAKGGVFYNEGKLWTPVGADYNNAFSGTFDGGKHVISGLKIKNNFAENNSKSAFLGMFGYVSGTVKNLTLRKVNFEGEGKYGYMGGIAGGVSGTISNCHVESGTITLKDGAGFFRASAIAGGIAGLVENGTVTGCHNAAAVTAVPKNNYDTAHAGGITGLIDVGTVSKCYNNGTADAVCMAGGAQAPSYAGGIAAVVSSGSVSDCYNTGVIRASYGNGGIAGLSYGSVSNCYNTAQIDRGSYGAIVGIQRGSMSGCFYRSNTTRGVGMGSDTATKLTVANMKKQATFKGFDFSKVWTMGGSSGYAYPELRSNTMLVPLKLSEMPAGVIVANGKSATVKVTATGSDLKYQWYVKSATGKEYSKSSNTTDTYKCTMSSSVNGRQVYCVVTDKSGESAKSNVVTLSNLVIKTQPKNMNAANGKSVSVKVTATGSGLKYQWYVKSAAGKEFTKSSNKTNTYKCTMSSSVNGRQLYCKVTDKFGNSVNTETVTVSNLAIKTQPKNTTAANGKSATVKVAATGSGLKYQWYVKSASAKSFTKTSNKTNTYKCTMSSSVNGRQAYCVVTDKYGFSVKSDVVTLSNLVIKTQPKDTTAANGKRVTVKVAATGSGLKYQWYIKSASGKTFAKSSTKTNTYKCTMSSSVNGRQVYCKITDKFGNSVKTETVTVSNLTIKTQPKSAKAANGKSVSVTVKATGSGLKYQWYYKNAGSSAYKKASVTSATYKCTMSSSVNGRKLYCKVTDKFGNTVKTETVTLKKR